jgi:two-component system, OmpR family, sensor histidine kinase KdpD
MRRWMVAQGRVVLALFGVAGVTLACLAIAGINATTVGFAFLLLVLAIAASWGLTEAVGASVAAMLCYNYFFLPPTGQFTIADPANWIALFAFLVTALVASHLSNRAKQQANEAKHRQMETEQLYALSRAILLTDATQPIGSQAARHISQIFGATGVVLFDVETSGAFQGGPAELHGLEDRLKQTVLQGTHHSVKDTDVDIWPISLGGHSIGALAVQGLHTSDGAVQALLNLVAIAIERVRTESVANRAEAARQSEEFKSTLLDAVAHEFKTPLTSIKAASTALLEETQRLTPEAKELLTVIDEETDRLNSLVTEAVGMSQIDAGKVRLERAGLSMNAILDPAIATFGNRSDGLIETTETSGSEQIYADREMIILALRQLIDNALKYAPLSTPIRVWTDRRDERVLIHVADQGPGIPEQDQERIFDKFYRRQKVRDKVPGSGLGLHIAREIARMHGGDLWVEKSAAGGTEFCLALPRFAEETA